MKKLTFLLVAMLMAFVLLQVNVPETSANGGPHGGYTATTDACAGCHRTHTAQGAQLLVANDTFALCMSCHGTAGTGADTNVQDGFFLSTRSASTEGTGNTTDVDDSNVPGTPTLGFLLGGGFDYYKGVATTSSHDVTNVVTGAWGNGGNRGVTAALAGGEALNCASCHDPHGSANYRILKETINGVATTVTQVDEGAANKDYDSENWPADMSNVCAACHSSYHVVAAGSGSDGTEALNGGYTHRVDMPYTYGTNVNPETVGFGGFNVPLGGADLVVCSTCHLSHGSSSAMAGFADGGPTGGGTLPGNTTATDSALLRLDNRGVCETCHQK